jgi:hypothetical protein
MNTPINAHSKKCRIVALTLASALLVSVSKAQVTPVMLSDANSVVLVDVNSDLGMYQWTVNGVNQLAQQWFWYRIGSSGPQSPINAISAASYFLSGPNSLTTTYANSQVGITVDYTLIGGTTGDADMLESITVQNISGAPLNLHFFQYSDFDLAGSPGGDSVSINLGFDGFDQASQVKGPTQISETINSPSADRAEAAFSGQTLFNLNNFPGYNLNNNQTAGPGDVAWALQWDFQIGPGSSVSVFKDKRLSIIPVPEPSGLVLVALGLTAFVLRRRLQS